MGFHGVPGTGFGAGLGVGFGDAGEGGGGLGIGMGGAVKGEFGAGGGIGHGSKRRGKVYFCYIFAIAILNMKNVSWKVFQLFAVVRTVIYVQGGNIVLCQVQIPSLVRRKKSSLFSKSDLS